MNVFTRYCRRSVRKPIRSFLSFGFVNGNRVGRSIFSGAFEVMRVFLDNYSTKLLYILNKNRIVNDM